MQMNSRWRAMSNATAIHEAMPGSQKLARRMQRAEALNEQAGMTRWTAEPERQRHGNVLTDEKNRERDPNEPWPTGHQHGNDADEHDCQPKARPHDEPRLSVEPA